MCICFGERARAKECESHRERARSDESVCVCAAQGKIEVEQQRALFAVTYGDKMLRFSLQLPPESERPAALVRPLRQQSDQGGGWGGREELEVAATAVACELSKWFSQLELDLDGSVSLHPLSSVPTDIYRVSEILS